MKRAQTLLALLVVLVFSIPGYSNTIYEFQNGPTTPNAINHSGADFSGTNLGFNLFTVFDTITFNEMDYPGSSASLNFNTATNSFSLTGDVTGLATSANLLHGSIGSPTISLLDPSSVHITLEGQGVMDPALSGLPANSFFDVFFDLSGGNQNSTGSPYDFTSGFVRATPIPEPSSLLLLTSGLLTALGFAKKKML